MSLGWWCISGEDLLAMLQEVAAGAKPIVVYAEHYANAEVSDSPADPTGGIGPSGPA